MSNPDQSTLLAGRKIAVPESRELNLFAGMLESRGAEIIRCPLVSIYDSPDKEEVVGWVKQFVVQDFDDLILLTGEGLRRLLGFAEREGGTLYEDFVARLRSVRKITRGPKPGNALRNIGLKPDVLAAFPTTEGVIETLSNEQLRGRNVAVQLYGTNPNKRLIDYLQANGAVVSTVAPYIYADDMEDMRVIGLIAELCSGTVDGIAFTSTPQVARLLQIASRQQTGEILIQALNCMQVAAVGPVVADALEAKGINVKVMPESTYFMKPLVRCLVKAFNHT